MAKHRRNVHDAAVALRHHRRRHQFAELPHSGDIQFHRRTKGVEVFVFDGDFVSDASVVDQHMHGAEPIDGLGHKPLTVFGLR